MSVSACSATAAGRTPILKVIKEAERILLETQDDQILSRRRGRQALRRTVRARSCSASMPTTIADRGLPDAGRLRRAASWLRADRAPPIRMRGCWSERRPGPTIRRSSARVGLEIVEYPYYDRDERHDPLRRHARRAAAGAARATSSLLHGCCHNPTGADLDEQQWAEVTEVVVERGLLPLVDIAYQGFGRGLDEDARGPARPAQRLRRSHRRAKLRQEFQRLSRPRRLAVRQDRLERKRRRRPWRTCSSGRAKCGRCRPIMARRRCGIMLDDAGAQAALAWSSSLPCATASTRFASGLPRPIRALPSSASNSACSRCFR